MNVEIVSDCNVEIFSNILKHFLSRSLIIFQHRIDNFLPVFEFEVSDALIQENPIDIREWGTRCSNTTSILPINSCKPVVFFIDHFFCKFISVFWKFWASWHNINQFSDKHGIVCYKKLTKIHFFVFTGISKRMNLILLFKHQIHIVKRSSWSCFWVSNSLQANRN